MQSEHTEEGPYSGESLEDRRARTVRQRWNWSLGTVIAAIVAFFPINKAYDQYHIRLARDVVVAEVQALQETLENTQETLEATQTTANGSAKAIDFLVKAEAARTADSLGVQLSILKAVQPRTQQTEQDIYNLEQRLNRAITYRDCVFDKRDNCDALRVW